MSGWGMGNREGSSRIVMRLMSISISVSSFQESSSSTKDMWCRTNITTTTTTTTTSPLYSSLKEARKIDWIHSLSTNTIPLPSTNETIAPNPDATNVHPALHKEPHGLSDKLPVHCAGGQCVQQLTWKAKGESDPVLTTYFAPKSGSSKWLDTVTPKPKGGHLGAKRAPPKTIKHIVDHPLTDDETEEEAASKAASKAPSKGLVHNTTILDPSCKMLYFEEKWGVVECEAAKDHLKQVFKAYHKPVSSQSVPLASSSGSSSQTGSSAHNQFVHQQLAQTPSFSLLDVFHKLEEYLSTPVEVISSIKYPTLGVMARDYLAIPGSSVSSERAFSSSGHTDAQTHNSLDEGTFSALQIAKDGCRKGIINGGKEALTWEPKDWIIE
ncbi:hypothetical protein D9756_007791 [Leucocoprinus leucothites]|uniref:HAT C-terminal dimerisation domain-containing protein n=1 Tax=Leucocoprinus leucothites TaxID=201217 RepID=A0A8H5D5R3_9AGAR|nr:hypothetical protein D9756_007791 [Leucoagaricus leucothites]